MKRILAVALLLAMLTALSVGCLASSAEQGNPAEQAIKNRLENGYETVNFTFFTILGVPTGIERIEAAMNAITEPELGITIDLQVIEIGAYSQNMNLMLNSGEKVDVFNTYALGIVTLKNKGNILDMYEDNLIQNYGQDILANWSEDSLRGCTIDAGLYGIPVKKDDATALWEYCVPEEYLEAIGIDFNSMYTEDNHETIKVDMEFIEDMLAKLHETYPEKTTMYIGSDGLSIGQSLLIDSPGGDAFGTLLDPANSLELSNLYESDIYYELCERHYRWNQMGYISMDAGIDSFTGEELLASGELCCSLCAGKPGYRTQATMNCRQPMVIFQVGENFKRSGCYSLLPWAINSMTDVKEAAMQVLNAFATDPRLSNLLIWGEEGVDYKITEDGHATFADGVTFVTAEYYHNVGWEMPNQFIAEVWEGNDLDIWNNMEKFNDTALSSKAMGFSWDNTAYMTQYTALINIYSEYRNNLELGFRDPAEGIPELVEALKRANIDGYIAAKQEALNAWAEINGVK